MKITHIVQKLAHLGVDISEVNLGMFDEIGEFTARKKRNVSDPLYSKVGAFFRPAYERGILLYYLTRFYGVESHFEIGFGRGYGVLCVAKAMQDMGTKGSITVVDIMKDEKHIAMLNQLFPSLMSMIEYRVGPSVQVLNTVMGRYDQLYIDGDHSYEGTLGDWIAMQNKINKVVLFDDYHLPEKEHDAGIQCAKAIDTIDFAEAGWSQPELIKLDRRIFLDDRGFTDEQIAYGQVLVTKL